MTKHFTDENFAKEVVEVSKTKPVLVDFFAEWCGPCKLQGPIIDQLADEMGEAAAIGKMNVEESSKTAEEYGVMTIPTLIVFKDGKSVANFTGLQNKDSLMTQIKKYL